jgi:segregation and condensation protein B
MDKNKQKSIIEGILFASGDSIEPEVIGKALSIANDEVMELLEELKNEYETNDRGVRLIVVDGKYQLCSSKDIYEYLIKIAKQPRKYVLTDVLLETLSIIAYKQPVTKAEIEKIRGVSSDHAVNRLVQFNLAQELGRLDAPGRPMLFGTTDDFLRAFGLSSTDDLPKVSAVQLEEWKQEAEEEAEREYSVDSDSDSDDDLEM